MWVPHIWLVGSDIIFLYSYCPCPFCCAVSALGRLRGFSQLQAPQAAKGVACRRARSRYGLNQGPVPLSPLSPSAPQQAFLRGQSLPNKTRMPTRLTPCDPVRCRRHRIWDIVCLPLEPPTLPHLVAKDYVQMALCNAGRLVRFGSVALTVPAPPVPPHHTLHDMYRVICAKALCPRNELSEGDQHVKWILTFNVQRAIDERRQQGL